MVFTPSICYANDKLEQLNYYDSKLYEEQFLLIRALFFMCLRWSSLVINFFIFEDIGLPRPLSFEVFGIV